MIANPATTLTQREVELVALYASGYDYRAIANAKFLSYSSVKRILADAREKVGAESLAHLCSLCVKHEVIVLNGQGFKPVVDPYDAT